MMPTIEVTKTIGRTTEQWIFIGDSFLPFVVLVRYCKTKIPAGKRNPVIVESWDYQNRTNPSPPPELTDDLKSEVLAKFVSRLKIVTWKEYKK